MAPSPLDRIRRLGGRMRAFRSTERHSGQAAPEPLIAEDVPSAMTRDELLALGALAPDRVALEIGSYFGRSTITLASVAQRVHAVDPHFPDQEGLGYVSTAIPFVENVIRYGVRDRIVIHLAASHEIVPLYPDAYFDLVFIDASHQREWVEKDLGLTRRVLRPGGVFAFHDYGVAGVDGPNGFEPFGVTEVVDAFAAELGVGVATVRTLAIVRTPAAR